MCYVLPAIIHRFESYLIALDACQALDLKVSPALALEALTKDSENSDEHGEDKISFKSGMGANYERLEFRKCTPGAYNYLANNQQSGIVSSKWPRHFPSSFSNLKIASSSFTFVECLCCATRTL